MNQPTARYESKEILPFYNAFSAGESSPTLQPGLAGLGETGVGPELGPVMEPQDQEFLWVTMVTSAPSLLMIVLFSALLVYIILKRLKDIMEMYLSVLAYAISMVGVLTLF